MGPKKSSAGREHRAVARDAGLGSVSVVSVVAGTLAAYGAFAIVAAIVGSLLTRLDVDTDFRTDDWTGSGMAAAVAAAAVLFVSYLFGGYVAGRMARRAAVLHGILVFVLSLIVGAIVGGVASQSEGTDIEGNLRSIGVPTSTDQVQDVAIASIVLSLVAILAGAIVGGVLGERWHTKLARRALDPEYGPEAEARARAERDRERRDEHVAHDEVVRREAAAEAARREGDRGSVTATDGRTDPGASTGATRGTEQVDLREHDPAWDRDPGPGVVPADPPAPRRR